MPNSKSLLTIAPLFLVIFIDSMGLGLLFPILNSIIIDPSSHFLAVATTVSTRNFLYGLTIGIFMICWFFGAAILGDLSDTVGRKKSLLICLLGSFCGYFISALAVIMHNLLFLIVGRVIAGFTSGSQPIAQAAIIDISADNDKARNIGMILLASSLGFLCGPIIGGVLSDNKLMSWFSFSVPLYFAAGISLLNALLLWMFFKESFQITGKIKIRLHHAISIFISAFQHKKIRWLSLVLLVLIFGWSNFFSFIAMFLLHRYEFTTLTISLFLALMASGFAIGCGFFVDYLTKRFSMKKITSCSAFITTIGVLVTVFTANVIDVWICIPIIGVAMAVAYSTILVMFSNQVGADEQGWVMGVSGAVMALCFGITTFCTGMVATFGVSLPLILSALGLGVSGVLILAFRETANDVNNEQVA